MRTHPLPTCENQDVKNATSPPIRAVLFDFGGVLTSSPFEGFVEVDRRLGYPDGTAKGLVFGDYRRIDSDHPWHRLERGEITAAEFGLALVIHAETAGYELDFQHVRAAFGAGMVPSAQMLAVVQRLRPAYKTAVLTNNVREYGEQWKAMMGGHEAVDAIFDSSDLGMRKPDPAIYRYACNALGVPPTQAAFLDDMCTNVKGAKDVGLAAIKVSDHMTAIEELKTLLTERGVAGWPGDV